VERSSPAAEDHSTAGTRAVHRQGLQGFVGCRGGGVDSGEGLRGGEDDGRGGNLASLNSCACGRFWSSDGAPYAIGLNPSGRGGITLIGFDWGRPFLPSPLSRSRLRCLCLESLHHHHPRPPTLHRLPSCSSLGRPRQHSLAPSPRWWRAGARDPWKGHHLGLCRRAVLPGVFRRRSSRCPWRLSQPSRGLVLPKVYSSGRRSHHLNDAPRPAKPNPNYSAERPDLPSPPPSEQAEGEGTSTDTTGDRAERGLLYRPWRLGQGTKLFCGILLLILWSAPTMIHGVCFPLYEFVFNYLM
jgi:hypothetical protein